MPRNLIDKQAAVTASGLDDLVKILKNTGKKFEAGGAANAVKDMYSKAGTGSITYDLFSSIPKKVLRFGGKKVPIKKSRITGKTKYKRIDTIGDKIKDGLDSAIERYQEKATDVDMKAGKWVSDKLKNTPAKNLFVGKQQFKVKDLGTGKPRQIIEVDTPSLSAPLDKAKKTVLPIVGAFALTSKMEEQYQKKKAKNEAIEGGEAMKKATSREELIEKIANEVSNKNIQVVVESPAKLKEQYKKLASLANIATEMLKTASVEIKQDKDEIQKLAGENKKLKLQLIAKNRSDRAIKLANLMHQKRLIKKADIDGKIDEIMDMDDKAYEVLAETVENLTIKTASDEGIDSLSYISEDVASEKPRKTLADEIDKLANEH